MCTIICNLHNDLISVTLPQCCTSNSSNIKQKDNYTMLPSAPIFKFYRLFLSYWVWYEQCPSTAGMGCACRLCGVVPYDMRRSLSRLAVAVEIRALSPRGDCTAGDNARTGRNPFQVFVYIHETYIF